MRLNAINNIIFIGFMGSGKSRIGQELSIKLNKKFIDVDSIIETRENMKIIDIFKTQGETYFRNLEKNFADEIKNSIQNSIIAVGGGFPINIKNIIELGYIIYLDIDFDYMIESLSKVKGEIEKRPLLQNLDIARNLYNSRKNIYKNIANMKIEIKSRNINEVVSEILTNLEKSL
jgi:shikimate kinase